VKNTLIRWIRRVAEPTSNVATARMTMIAPQLLERLAETVGNVG
jgi:hypothetical protein